MNPLLAQGLAAVVPLIVALLTKAEADNRTRAIVSVVLIALLTVGTYLGDAYPDTLEAVAAQVATLAAIVIGAYQLVQGLLGDLDLNDLLVPSKGIR